MLPAPGPAPALAPAPEIGVDCDAHLDPLLRGIGRGVADEADEHGQPGGGPGHADPPEVRLRAVGEVGADVPRGIGPHELAQVDPPGDQSEVVPRRAGGPVTRDSVENDGVGLRQRGAEQSETQCHEQPKKARPHGGVPSTSTYYPC